MRIMIIDLNQEVYFWRDDMRLVMSDWFQDENRLYWKTPHALDAVIDEVSAAKYSYVNKLQEQVRDYLLSSVRTCNLCDATIGIIDIFSAFAHHKVQANE